MPTQGVDTPAMCLFTVYPEYLQLLSDSLIEKVDRLYFSMFLRTLYPKDNLIA